MIQTLSQEVVNQIAAGEVVDRPASVVKELMENALDAGADHIVVRVVDGGREEIVVEDNGSGIVYEDIKKVFEPHATSKLSSIEDLDRLDSMGFRGEALASIASVAKVSLETKSDSGQVYGYRYIQEGHKSSKIAKMAKSNTGSMFRVQELFSSVPARKKFLKTRSTELSYIVQVVERVALAYPEVTVELYSDHRRMYRFVRQDALSRTVAVLSLDNPQYLIPVEYVGDHLTISGFVGHPRLSRTARVPSQVFVNRRPIKHSAIQKAIQAGFDTLLEVNHYPVYVLFLEVPSYLVDVNVHPRKSEVKFHDEREVFSKIRATVREALRRDAFSVVMTPAEPKMRRVPFQNGIDSLAVRESSVQYTRSTVSHSHNPFRQEDTRVHHDRLYQKPTLRSLLDPISKTANPEGVKEVRQEDLSLGDFIQVFDTYILYKNQGGVMVFDQHAVHEKVLLEKLIHAPDTITSHPLLIPITVSIPQAEVDQIMEVLAEIPGLEVEAFGSRDIVVRAVPSFLMRFDKMEYWLNEMIESVLALKEQYHSKDLQTEIYKTVACKAAIKAGMKLSEKEIVELIAEAKKTDFGFACCHGRPTMVQLDQDWFEKQFSRK